MARQPRKPTAAVNRHLRRLIRNGTPDIRRANGDAHFVEGLSDIDPLLASLGTATVPAFYDARAGVTATSGVAAAWDDVRGAAGFGPQLVGAGTSRPSYDGATLSFDGVDDWMGTAAPVAGFDIAGNKSVVVVGALAGGTGSKLIVGIHDSTSNNRQFGVGEGTGGVIATRGTAGTGADSTVALSGVVRLVVAGKNESPDTYFIDIPNGARVTGNSFGPSAGSNHLVVGGFFGTGHFALGVVRAVLVLNRVATAGDLSALAAWAVATHGAVLA